MEGRKLSGHLATGAEGERIAEDYLRREGYTIVARNYMAGVGRHCKGEIDLVAIRRDVVHFVEVKCRRNDAEFGDFSPEAAFTAEKVVRMKRAASNFIRENRLELDIAFSLIAINLPSFGEPRVRFYGDMRV